MEDRSTPKNPRPSREQGSTGSGSTPAPGAGAPFDPALLLYQLPEPLFCLDGEGLLLWINEAAEQLTGYPAADLQGQSFVVLVSPPARGPVARFFVRERVRGSSAMSRELPLVTRDGRTVWVGARVAPLRGPAGEVRFVACATDFTTGHHELDALRRKLDELARRAEEATATARLKGEFLASMSHEIRTPMNGVIGMARLLADSNLDRDQRAFVQVIERSSEALLTLINDILDLSKIEAGRLELENLDFDLRVTVEGVAALLAPRANEKGVQLACTVHHEVPSALRGDPGRLRQILINLAGNAVKFTEAGEVAIRVEMVGESVHQVMLRISVTDTGIGMNEEQLTMIFKAFQQAEPTIARRFGGTGLGLAISRKLVSLMGGEVWVESEAGKGSTFGFRVPFEKGAIETITPAPRVEFKDLRVLVADPARNIRTAITEMLTAWGCLPEEAATGPDALAALRAAAGAGEPFRVALLDMDLPGVDAEVMAKEIRSDATIRSTLLMLLTNLGRRGDAAAAQQAGFSAYLLKPVQQSHLYDALAEVIYRGVPKPPSPPLVTRHSLEESRRRRVRVLLVEDNPVNQLVALAALRRAGYAPDLARDGAEAVAVTAKQNYDLVFMDVQMPGMDGYEATGQIRKREAGGRRTPIIAVTAHALEGDRQHCIAAGMDDYLTKPVDLDLMCRMVADWTREAEPPPATAPSAPAPALRPAWNSGMPSSAAPAPVARPAEAVTAPGPDSAPVVDAAPRPNAAPVADPGAGRFARAEHEGESSAPTVDEARLRSTSMDKPELRRVLVTAFLTNAKPRLAHIRQLVANGDAEAIEFEGHGMKGMCATMGAMRCAELFARIESMAREKRLEPVLPLLDRAEIEIAQVEALIAPGSEAA